MSCAEDDGTIESQDEGVLKSLSPEQKGKGKATAEYEDEEQLATVTIIDELDPDSLHHAHWDFGNADDTSTSSSGSPRTRRASLNEPKDTTETDPPLRRASNKDGSARSKKKTRERQKKVAYETKAARKAARTKQRSRMKEKTDMAMDKHRRKMKKKGK